jgi:hypothetical protein
VSNGSNYRRFEGPLVFNFFRIEPCPEGSTKNVYRCENSTSHTMLQLSESAVFRETPGPHRNKFNESVKVPHNGRDVCSSSNVNDTKLIGVAVIASNTGRDNMKTKTPSLP